MSVDLAPDIWNEIQRHVASGVFATPDEVLREALTALRSREEAVREREEVREALREAAEDLKAGRHRPATEVSRDMRRKYNLPE